MRLPIIRRKKSEVEQPNDPAQEAEVALDLAIGVGCLTFTVDDPEISQTDYFQRVSSLLSSIENITDVKLSGTSEKYGGLIDLSGDDEDTSEIMQHVYYSSVEFSIFIPRKVQKRLEAVCGSERFKVLIHGDYHMPVTYISGPVSDFPHFNPSWAVVLVRRYLQEKIKESKEMSFGCIGPSPFHADFLTSHVAPPESLKDVTEGVGYKTYVFGYADDETSGLRDFVRRYGDTFSLFYYLQHLRSKIIHADRRIFDGTNSLLNGSKTAGWFSGIRWSATSGKLIDEINDASLRGQFLRGVIRSLLEDAEKDEPKDRFEDLEYHFNEARQFGVERDASAVRGVVETSERRRQSLFQNLAVLIAGLAGGVLGAILGSALTFALTAERPAAATQVSPAELVLRPAQSPSGYCVDVPGAKPSERLKLPLKPTLGLPFCPPK